ncbi:thymidylate synthase [Clostridium sp. Marseille-Q2269]|uniref:thymidylate synthase n=1 Tax=Clostridium sp. Marseille-Q2269 TaxID=2942205 RepID=UPI002072CC76|nr:thymidylate synthase [Clostridium sp. Marseille-Q2269]
MKFKKFHEAYLKNLKDVYYNPEFINQPRGNVSKERLNYFMVLENPRDRICYTKSRKTNIVFNFAEALWYLSGSNDLDYISYYASNMKKYSMDDKTLTGTAYGPKIFSYGHKRVNQWDRLIELFKEDPDTKRGFIEIFNANEDLSLKNIDVSCTIGFQFLLENINCTWQVL